MSGFDNRQILPTNDDRVQTFSGVTNEIKKGDVVGVAGKKLETMEPIAGLFGEVSKKALPPEVVVNSTIDQHPHSALVGVMPDGTEIYISTDSAMYLSQANQDIDLIAVKKDKVVAAIQPSPGFLNIGFVAAHPTKNRVYFLKNVQNTDQGWNYSSFIVEEYDETLTLISTSPRIDQSADNCMPHNVFYGGLLCTADDYLCLMMFSFTSRHQMLIYNVATQTLKQDGATLVPGPRNTSINQSFGNGFLYHFLNKEKTRFAYTNKVYQTGGAHYNYTWIIEPSAVSPVLSTTPIDHTDSSPFSSSVVPFCDLKGSCELQRYKRIFQAESDENIIYIASSNGPHHLKITGYNIFDPVNISIERDLSMSCNRVIASFQLGDHLFFVRYYHNALYGTCINMVTHTATNNTLANSYNAHSYQYFFYDADKELLFMPYSTSTSPTALNNIFMLVFKVNTCGEFSLVADVQHATGNKGKIRGAVEVREKILVLQGGYSTAADFVDLRYHLFDKETLTWDAELLEGDHRLREYKVNENQFLNNRNSWPIENPVKKFSTDTIRLFGYGLKHVSNSTEGYKHLDIQLAKVNTFSFIGVADKDRAGDKIDIHMEGYAGLNEKYHSIFKKVDHSEIGGNKARFLGSVVHIKEGGF